MKKYVCDACGKKIELKDPLDNVFDLLFNPSDKLDSLCEITIKHNVSNEKHFDLCKKCAVKFADALDQFFKEEEKEKEK